MAAAVVAVAFSGPGVTASPDNPAKVIYAGWYGNTIPTPSFIASNFAFLESQPFDGIVVYLRNANLTVNLTTSVMKPTAISYDTMASVLQPLAALNFSTLRENLGLVQGSTPPDFFDDWSVVVQNHRNLARAARNAGLKGLCFDNEQYAAPWGNYGSNLKYYSSKTFAQYEAQARLRGKEVMEAMVAEFPDIVFLTLHGPYVSEPDAPSSLQFPQWQSGNELLGPYFAGNLEGAGTTGCAMDGGEIYTLRTLTEFNASGTWRKTTMASDAVNCSFIPPSLRTVWPSRTSISFGVYDMPFAGASMSPTILRSTLANSMRSADKYVWYYAEASTYLLPSSAGGASTDWVNAIRLAREDVAAAASTPPPTGETGAPTAPSNLSATGVSTSSVTLGWTDNSSNENGFSIEGLFGSTWTQIATVGAGVTSYTNTGLNSGTSYSYRVRAFNASGNSAASNSVTASTSASSSSSGLAAAPTSLVASGVTTSSITLSWTDNSTNENGFSIERLSGGTWSQVGWVADNVTTTTRTGLTPETAYSFRVLAFNGFGNSATTNAVTATTASTTPPTISAPSNLAVTSVTSASVTLGWTDNSTNENGFSIEEQNGTTWSQIATVGSNVTTYAHSGLSELTSHTYRVVAFNSTGNSSPSNSITGQTTSAIPSNLAAAPTDLVASGVTTTSVALSWTDHATNENGFSIEQQVAGTWTQIGTVAEDVQSYTASGLNPATAYAFRVLAFNAFGNSLTTNEVTVTTSAPVTLPNAPTGLSASMIANRTVRLTWTDTSTNETGFAIERRRLNGSWSQIGTVGAGGSGFNDKGRQRGETYVYRMRSYNSSGFSAYTPELQYTVPN